MISDAYATMAERLKALTGFVPIQIDSGPLSDERPVNVFPLNGHGQIIGIRLFHEPRQIVLRRITRGAQMLVGPVDAAAYALEGVLPPLEPDADPASYRGDIMRFVAVDWGVIARIEPLIIDAEPWGSKESAGGSVTPPSLDGYLVVEPATSLPGHAGGPWPGHLWKGIP